jgi:hypothetical protein
MTTNLSYQMEVSQLLSEQQGTPSGGVLVVVLPLLLE